MNPRSQDLRAAAVRLVLGLGQISGATAAAVLLLEEGVTRRSVGAVAVTGPVSLFSRFVFPRQPRRTNEDA